MTRTDTLRRTVARKARKGGLCEWFALCQRPAVTTVPHPVLGSVPTCAECAAWVERMGRP